MTVPAYSEIRPRVREWICNRAKWLKKLRPERCGWTLLAEIARRIAFELELYPRSFDLRALDSDLASLGWQTVNRCGDAWLVHTPRLIEAKPIPAEKRVVGPLATDAIREARPRLKTQRPRIDTTAVKTFADLAQVLGRPDAA